MAPYDAVALDIEWRCAKAFGDACDLIGGHEQKHSFRIDEAPDQPWASDSIDLWPRTRDPHRAALRVARGQSGLQYHRMPCLGPGGNTAIERLGIGAGLTEPGRSTLTQPVPCAAGRDDIVPGIGGSPLGDIIHRPANRARDQAWVIGKILIRADIDDGWPVGSANEPGKLVDWNRVQCRHGAPLKKAGRDTSACRLMG